MRVANISLPRSRDGGSRRWGSSAQGGRQRQMSQVGRLVSVRGDMLLLSEWQHAHMNGLQDLADEGRLKDLECWSTTVYR